MEIILKEPRFQLSEKYLIKVTETEEEFIGTNIGFLVFDHIILNKDRRQVIEAKRRFRPFRKRYFDIAYNDSKGHFKQLTRFKPSYEMTLNGITYNIIEHWGKKFSIFLNDIQIASIVQVNDISFNQNDTFQLLLNNNIDPVPIILATMILDSPGNEGSTNNMLTIDLGNVAGEKLPFDHKWKPNLA